MNDPSRINELFSRWQNSRAQGLLIGAEELCRDCPQLLAPLQQRIEAWIASRPGADAPSAAAAADGSARTSLFEEQAATLVAPAGTPDGWPTQAGGYQIIEEIARGGMGAVLRAFDPEFQRTLAVKVMLQRAGEWPELRERFLAEARITGQLQHPGIPPAHELGELEDGRPFFAMKLIEGRTLAELLPDPFPATPSSTNDEQSCTFPSSPEADVTPSPEDLSRLLSIFEQICQTLAYAHSRGVIHRDLKPANVMVGEFGEVQVMDWGLAKILSPTTQPESAIRTAGTPTDSRNTEIHRAAAGGRIPSAEQTVDYVPDTEPNPPEARVDRKPVSRSDSSTMTEAGEVIGTLAYMPPEQARGQIDQLDARCDVFGLGAMLCQILTGRPPYPAATGEELLHQAAAGKLNEAFARLQHSGADPELVRLAQSCLARERDERPRDAGVVAEAVAQHQARVAERLRQAELDRQAAQVKAAEQRKRRTMRLALIGSVAVLVVGAGFWWQNKRAEESARRASLHQRITSDLSQIEKLQRRSHLKEAEIVLAQAKTTLGAAGPADLRERLDQAEAYLELLIDLDAISMSKIETVQNKADLRRTAQAFEQRFREPPLNLHPGISPGDAAQRIRELPVREHLIPALDDWAMWTGNDDHRAWCLAVARLLDPGPWRDRFRDPEAWRDREALERLAGDADIKTLPPHMLSILGNRLRKQGSDVVAFLKTAHLHHPDSFWINHELGYYYTDTGQTSENKSAGVEFFRAALAIRPDAPVNHTNLAWALIKKGDLEEAVRHIRKALEMNPRSALAYVNLGVVQSRKGDVDGAIKYYRQAVDCDPKLAGAWNNLGINLLKKKDVDGAIEHFRRAIKADPRSPSALSHLGEALMLKGDQITAADYFRRALEIDPDSAETYVRLGTAIYTADRDAAIEAYRNATRADPLYAHAHFSLGYALLQTGDLDESARALQTAIRLNQTYALSHQYLGEVRLQQVRFADACDAFEKAMMLLPENSAAREHIAGLLKQGRRLLELEQLLVSVQQGQASAKDAAEHIELAELCGRYKKYYASAARFYAAAFTAEPRLAEDVERQHRYAAARVALLAADRQGKEPVKIQPEDQIRWRKQALDWLKAELAVQRKRLNLQPRTVVAVQDALAKCQSDPDLASTREKTTLSRLPEAEQQGWREFWSAVEQLHRESAAHYVETRLDGTVSASQLEAVHPLKMAAGTTYVIEMQSNHLDSYLRLEDAQSRTLDENDDIVEARNKNSRIIFTPGSDGTYRIVATSHRQYTHGAYQIVIRAFAGGED